MNFSDSFNCNNRLCHFSPDGTSLAHVDGHYKLFIRNARSLTVQQMFTCLDEISHISWSPDSSMVLCAMYKRARVQIFSLENTDWTCKIDEGSYGLVSAVWSSDSLSVLTTSEFNLRITVWSLTTKSVAYIKYPKAIPAPIQFSGRSIGQNVFNHSLKKAQNVFNYSLQKVQEFKKIQVYKEMLLVFLYRRWPVHGTG